MIKFLTLCLFALAAVANASAQPMLSGTVTKIVDPRTIVVESGPHKVEFRIQLRGIETPDENQALYDTVEAHLSSMLLGKFVTFLPSVDLVNAVYLNGNDVTAQLIRDGAAWMTLDPNFPLPSSAEDTYRRQESIAKLEQRGVWAIPLLTRPTELRRIARYHSDPLKDAEVAQAAWRSLGPNVESVFGVEIHSIESSSCSGVVERVVDGDTVKVRTPSNSLVTVRLAGIDAPEMRQSAGLAAKKALSVFVLGKKVSCESSKKDRYGRAVGKLLVDGRDVSLQMILGCHAWHYKKYQREQSESDRIAYSEADSGVKTARCGIFEDQAAIAPWDFRTDLFLSTYVWRVDELRPAGSVNSRGSSGGSSTPSSGSGPVEVKGYYRKDGTYVRPHTRSRPKN